MLREPFCFEMRVFSKNQCIGEPGIVDSKSILVLAFGPCHYGGAMGCPGNFCWNWFPRAENTLIIKGQDSLVVREVYFLPGTAIFNGYRDKGQSGC